MDSEFAATATSASHELVPQLRFPPGYRFVPTEDELVDVYLRAKIEGRELPLQVVNDVSILDWQPGSLVEAYKGYGENRWFFFAVREQSSSNKEKEPSRKVRVEGVTASWKATGSVHVIRRRRRAKNDGGGNRAVVGSKRVLIYSSSDPNENGKWSMHEYILQGHDQIGQYALYSIQRKQHSDTEDKVGNDDMDPEKKARKRKRTEKPCTEPEGVQLPHPETTTLLAKPPLNPTRKTKAQRNKKPSMQPPAADGAPALMTVVSAVPLQAVRVLPPSEPDGTTLGASTPSRDAEEEEEDTLDGMSKLPLLCNSMLCNNQGQEQRAPSLAGSSAFLAAPDTNVVGDHAMLLPYQYQQQSDGYGSFAMQNQHLSLEENQSVYMVKQEQYTDFSFLPAGNTNTTQPMNSSCGGWWEEHGDDQHRQVHHQQQEQKETNVVDHAMLQAPYQQQADGYGSFAMQNQQHLSLGENQSVYMGQEQYTDFSFFQGNTNTIQPMNSSGGDWWEEHGDDQHRQVIHHQQQENNGVQDRPMNNSDEQYSAGSDDPQVDGLLLDGGVQMDDEAEAFVTRVLLHDQPPPPPPEDLAAGTQEQEGGDDPATLQAAGTGTQEQEGGDDPAILQAAGTGTQEQKQGGDDPATTLQAAAGTQEQGADGAATTTTLQLQSLQHDDLQSRSGPIIGTCSVLATDTCRMGRAFPSFVHRVHD